MIFLTVGTHSQQFNRLLKAIDYLVENKIIKDKVIAQIGNSTYKPRNYTYYKFIEEKKMQKLYKNSKIIVMHAGVGSIVTALMYKKPIVIVPRLKKFNEHINDHQLQITKEFEKEKKVLACFKIENLAKLIQSAYKFNPKISIKQPEMFKIIQNFLSDLR